MNITIRKRKLETEEEMENDGATWRRGQLLGKGGFGSVYLAKLKKPNSKSRLYPPIMAVKSAKISESSSLQEEKEVFNDLYGCPNILQCYGEETTVNKNGDRFYNVLLEYASGGTLATLIQKSDGYGLALSDIRRYTKCILEGISYIHSRGYVHCDLKPENVLLVSDKNGDFVPKIADFGLSKKLANKKRKLEDSDVGGTTMYMAPETLTDRIQDFPCDIWALGCIVFEMFTGYPLWYDSYTTTDNLVKSIVDIHELPEIPDDIPDEGRAFLKRCLVKNPRFRFTAEMLLHHSLVSDIKGSAFRKIFVEEHVNLERFCDSTHAEDWGVMLKEEYILPNDRLRCVAGTHGRHFEQLASIY